MQSELIWRTVFKTRVHAKNAIGQYIDAFYNPNRRHSSLRHKCPIKLKRQAITSAKSLYLVRNSSITLLSHKFELPANPI
ncbi:hypothetical protein FHY56_00670 [Brucella gallinifaecis]|uniref:Integrase catalytic domain-containing protein n=1 Tax=Brucella gallinifaecis TaxID=215590 RepID=A0A502BRH2_9HYPH|nr:hypothetical protein FHY56_00670 [Brucella gallinifaecis]